MIIHSAEYFIALRSELCNIKSHMQSMPYAGDVKKVIDSIDGEIKTIDNISHNCIDCFNRVNDVCNINGLFPDNIDKSKYHCGAWIYDDIPF